jgi:predicted nucleotidyltransferase
MTPEKLVDELKQALPNVLRSVVLYGSTAAGDHVAGKSDYNVLVVAERLGVAELNALSSVGVAWAKAGNRPPLLFTPKELARSADVFPIELLDIQDSRKLLFGDDPLTGIKIDHAHLRVQLEHDLKAKLLYLRERYLLTRGKTSPVLDLMTDSLSTFLVLLRAALRLYEGKAPPRKLDATLALAKHISFEPQVFVTVSELKSGSRKRSQVSAASLFESYLQAIEQIVEALDQRIHTQSRGNQP